LIWNVHRESLSSKSHVEFVLNKHLRAISDIHWSPFSPELVATCSYDAYIHCWDLRSSPEKPSISFCGWNAGATQVKFNRINEYLLASSHDTDIRVWDTRKGSSPTTLITAHRTKIYGLDWSLSKEDELLTCSQDTLVKIWNIKTPRNCLFTIETSSPCWRARYTPFGNSILTMPQRKDNSLYLWNLDRPEAPAYTFAGHVDTPTEFVWRYQGKNESTAANGDFSQEYQLVTWSKDMHLRLWPIGKEIAASAGVVIADDTETPRSAGMLHSSSSPRNIKPRRNYSDTQLHGASSGSDSIADYESYPDSSSNNSMKTALSRSRDSASDEESIVLDNDLVEIEKELDNVQSLFPSIYIDRTNLGSRRCTIRLERIDPSAIATSKQANKQILFQVNITFPKGYPKVPVFCDIQVRRIILRG
jgi:WD40 repeat protein